MNNKVFETISKHEREAYSGLQLNRVYHLTSLYLRLIGTDVSPELVGAWLHDEYVDGMCMSKAFGMSRVSERIVKEADTQYAQVCVGYLGEIYSELCNGYYITDYMGKILHPHTEKEVAQLIRDAKYGANTIEQQAARIFAVVTWLKSLGDHGVLSAALMCDFHLLINGVGSFAPSPADSAYISNEIKILQQSEVFDFGSMPVQNIVATIDSYCITKVQQ